MIIFNKTIQYKNWTFKSDLEYQFCLYLEQLQEAGFIQEFGYETLRAVKEFQANEKLPVTGVVDKRTWERLEKISKNTTKVQSDFRDGSLNLETGGDPCGSWLACDSGGSAGL